MPSDTHVMLQYMKSDASRLSRTAVHPKATTISNHCTQYPISNQP